MTVGYLEALAVGASALWCVVGVYWFWLAGRIPALPRGAAAVPGVKVSVVVTACNEADTIGPALASLLSLSYRPLELIIVNDRSTDATGSIIEDLIADHDHARVVHNDVLPEGWLGKVHALHLGAAAASGDWLLFTDADVVYRDGVISDAVAHVESRGLDHFSLLPTMKAKTWPLDITVCAFTQLGVHRVFGLSPVPFGAGAFNMVRRRALDASAGIEWLRMEVADDAGLALLIAEAGGPTEFRTALDGLEIAWYPSLGAMFRGLEKNASLVASHGKPWRMALIWSAGCTAMALPFMGPILNPELWAALCIGMGAFICATFRLRLRLGTHPWLAILAPLGFVLVGTCGLWSMIQNRRQGGIEWRGTFYPWSALVEGQRVRL